MVSFDGENKHIEISGELSITALEIYSRAKEWEEENIEYSSPMLCAGKAPLGGGAYTDIIYILSNGWKLKPVGYSEDQVIAVTGTLITDDNSPRTVAIMEEGCPTWEFQVATSGIVTEINTGSGLTTEQNAKLNEIHAKSAFIPNEMLLSLKKFVGLK